MIFIKDALIVNWHIGLFCQLQTSRTCPAFTVFHRYIHFFNWYYPVSKQKYNIFWKYPVLPFDPVFFFESRKTKILKSEYIKGQIVLQLIFCAGHVGHMSEWPDIYLFSGQKSQDAFFPFKRLSRRRPFKKSRTGEPLNTPWVPLKLFNGIFIIRGASKIKMTQI